MDVTRDAGISNLDKMIHSRSDWPYGISWEDWTANWWKWVLSIPREVNPGLDMTGRKFQYNHDNPEVLYMIGTFGGFAERSFTIPNNKSILVPVINFCTSFLEEPHLTSETDLKTRARQDIDDITSRSATVDNVIVPNLEDFRVQSPVFDLTFPEDNVFELPAGETKLLLMGIGFSLSR